MVSGLGHGQFSTDPTANLINANSTWSNTLKRDDYSNEGTYVSAQIVAVYSATTAAGWADPEFSGEVIATLQAGSPALVSAFLSVLNNALATSPANSTTNLVAASTVDLYAYIQINQTNTWATYTIPTPTSATRGIHLWISNTGTAAFVIDWHIINSSSTAHFVFDGTGWSETEVSRHDSFLVITTTWSIPNTIDTVVINNWATAITLTMPTKISGKVITLMRGIGSTWGITVNPWWWQIEALANTLWATTTLAASGAVWQNVMFMCDWTNWLRKNNG